MPYKQKTVGVRDGRRAATIGELRSPVVFCKSVRTPDGGVGFTQVFTKYGQGWAKVINSPQKPINGEASDPKKITRFIVRHPGYLPALADFILYGTQFYQIDGVAESGNRDEFLRIDGVPNCEVTSANFSNGASTATGAAATEATNFYQNPLFDSGPAY